MICVDPPVVEVQLFFLTVVGSGSWTREKVLVGTLITDMSTDFRS